MELCAVMMHGRANQIGRMLLVGDCNMLNTQLLDDPYDYTTAKHLSLAMLATTEEHAISCFAGAFVAL